jgi:hypothetical protein
MAIGLLVLVCALLIAALATLVVVRHRHNEQQRAAHPRSAGWIESDHLCG